MTGAREILLGIYRERGSLTKEIVLDEATPEASPLHGFFTWDEATAAHERRLEQAAELIRSCRTKLVTAEGRIYDNRSFVGVPRVDDRRMAFEPTEEVLADEFKRRQLLDAMQREWKIFKARYEGMAEFADFIRQNVA